MISAGSRVRSLSGDVGEAWTRFDPELEIGPQDPSGFTEPPSDQLASRDLVVDKRTAKAALATGLIDCHQPGRRPIFDDDFWSDGWCSDFHRIISGSTYSMEQV
jgi:hypothetical protein